eukprot:gene10790-7516_t
MRPREVGTVETAGVRPAAPARAQDMTRKAKSFLLLHRLMVGVLVVNATLVANSVIPRVLTGVLDRVGTLP